MFPRGARGKDVRLTEPADDRNGGLEDQGTIRLPNLRSDRSGTLKLLSWWKHDTVRAATVMIVGLGALGNEVAKNLALLGIGRLIIVDRDTVEMSNLSRSVLFRESDQGRRKTEVVSAQIQALNPDVDVLALHGDVTMDIGLGLFRRVDVVVGCLDSRAARLWLNDSCYLAGIPWVDGAIQDMFGEVRVFMPGSGACYACTLSASDWRIIREARPCNGLAVGNILEGRVPTTPTIGSIIGGIQSQEALKLVHGMPSHPGMAFVFRGLTTEADLLTLPRKDGCQSHYTLSEVTELPLTSAATFRDLLREAHARLGEEAYLMLRGRELVSHLECPACGGREDLGVLEVRLTTDLARCPSCGHGMREAETTHVITDRDPFVDRTLSDAGFPLLDVIEARNATDAVALELTGDLSEVVPAAWMPRP